MDLHDQVVNELYAQAAGVPNDRQAIMAGGLGGAGKSTVLSTMGIDQSRYLTLNPDDAKELILNDPRFGFQQTPGMSPLEHAPLIHEESSIITNRLAEKAYADGKNVIWDSTMGSEPSAAGKLSALEANGYKTSGVFVDITPQQSVERAMGRWQRGLEDWSKGKGEGGRYVPPSYILREQVTSSGNTKNHDIFNSLRSRFSSYSIYDNRGSAPRLTSKGKAGLTESHVRDNLEL